MQSTRAAAQPSDAEGTGRNLTSISPFFIVKDLRASISYYIERLGFQLDFQLSFMDESLRGFEVTDAGRVCPASARVRNEEAQ